MSTGSNAIGTFRPLSVSVDFHRAHPGTIRVPITSFSYPALPDHVEQHRTTSQSASIETASTYGLLEERRDDCFIFVWDGMHAVEGSNEEVYLNVSIRLKQRRSMAVDFIF